MSSCVHRICSVCFVELERHKDLVLFRLVSQENARKKLVKVVHAGGFLQKGGRYVHNYYLVSNSCDILFHTPPIPSSPSSPMHHPRTDPCTDPCKGQLAHCPKPQSDPQLIWGIQTT